MTAFDGWCESRVPTSTIGFESTICQAPNGVHFCIALGLLKHNFFQRVLTRFSFDMIDTRLAERGKKTARNTAFQSPKSSIRQLNQRHATNIIRHVELALGLLPENRANQVSHIKVETTFVIIELVPSQGLLALAADQHLPSRSITLLVMTNIDCRLYPCNGG